MKKFITFGAPAEKFHDNVKRICKEAYSFEFFDEVIGFTEQDLINDKPFWEKHKYFILNNKRGYGYYIWKAHLINKELEKMQENDILIFADAGCEMNKYGKQRFLEYIDILNNDPNEYGLICFQTPHKEITFSKKKVLDYFNKTYFNKTKNIDLQYQCMSGVQIIKKTKHSSNLMKLWSIITKNYDLINDNIDKNESILFHENRHEQSVYSMLVHKFGSIKLSERETDYFAESSNNPFPIIARRLTH